MEVTIAKPTRKRPYLAGRRLLNRHEFEQIADSGAFAPEERLELIDGEIVSKEHPMKSAHATGVTLSEQAVRQLFSGNFTVRVQLSLALSEYDEPLPDVAVVVGSPRDYEEEHPAAALLVIEVSETTLRMDQTTKASQYARAGIRDYWIVNLIERLLEVHRDPVPMRGKPLGYAYNSVVKYGENTSVAPLALPEQTIAVADLLPRPRG